MTSSSLHLIFARLRQGPATTSQVAAYVEANGIGDMAQIRHYLPALAGDGFVVATPHKVPGKKGKPENLWTLKRDPFAPESTANAA